RHASHQSGRPGRHRLGQRAQRADPRERRHCAGPAPRQEPASGSRCRPGSATAPHRRPRDDRRRLRRGRAATAWRVATARHRSVTLKSQREERFVPSLNADKDVPWWRDSVVYQLYLRSFADADGDGIGDFDGITEHLDHIESLGVDAIWLNPCYPSPNRDGGYDVADFTTVDQVYGGMPAFTRMLDAAHARGLRVLMDLVPNHCSNEHRWFQEALRSAPGSPGRSRFHFRDGRGADGAEPPNNWRSTFGGPAWTRVVGADGVPEQWYLHSFDASQPDFNWSNPEVGDMFADVL